MPGAGGTPARSLGDGTGPPGRGRTTPPPASSAGLATRIHVGGEASEYAMAVLDAVGLIPRGRVMTYGDVAEYVGSGTGRHVGAVLSRFGHEDVPWHRVVRSTGEPNPTRPGEALRRLRADGTPLRPSGERVDLAAARWDGDEPG